MQPTEFLDTAARLCQGGTEGDWRSAASRSYYGVFHFFREFFRAHGMNLGRSGQSHFNLYAGLLHCGFAAVARIGTSVDNLRDERVKADYDLTASVDRNVAADAVALARAILVDFQTILQNIAPALIVAGARQHLQAIGKLGKTP